MSKHNYSQYSNKNQQNKPKPIDNPVPKPVSDVKPVLVKETVETVAIPETIEGVVANCAKLNVRVAPNPMADIVCVLDAMSEIEIDVSKSTDEWFKICTAIGAEGYCMRKFIDAHL